MEQLVTAIADHLVWFLILVVISLWAIGATFESVYKSRHRERTNREIAAYVAEGSMTPEQAERLLTAMRHGDALADAEDDD